MLYLIAVTEALNDMSVPKFNPHRNPEEAHAQWIGSHYAALTELVDATESSNWVVNHPLFRPAIHAFHLRLVKLLANIPRRSSLFALQYHYEINLARALAELEPARLFLATDTEIENPDRFHRSLALDLRILLRVVDVGDVSVTVDESSGTLKTPEGQFEFKSSPGLKAGAATLSNAIKTQQNRLKHIRLLFEKLSPVVDVDEPKQIEPALVQLWRSISHLKNNPLLDSVSITEDEAKTLAALDALHAEVIMAIKRYLMSCPLALSGHSRLRSN